MTSLPILVRCKAIDRDGHIVLKGRRSVPVSVVPLKELESLWNPDQRKKFESSYGHIPQLAEARLLTLNRLLQAIRTRDPGNLGHLSTYAKLAGAEERTTDVIRCARDLGVSEDWCRRMAEETEKRTGYPPFGPLGPATEQYYESRVWERLCRPLPELSRKLNRRLQSVRLVIWWVMQSQIPAPGLFCPDIETALFALTFSRIASPQGWSVCLRCSASFMRTRRDQKYCSLRCGGATRKARERKRKRASD